jgi:release factor glutamine methyltransferase
MNRKEALDEARKLLSKNNIDDAALESEILLRVVLKLGRAQLFLELNRDINTSDFKNFIKLVKRRIRGEPTAYIVGIKEFYGFDFVVNKNVLIPRPETELMVEQAISLCRQNNYSKVADVGTGCGAIAVSLAMYLPAINIFATDISSQALKVAKHNATRHSVIDRITFLKGDMVKPLNEPVDLIVANLPYVKTVDIKGSLRFEPRRALNGGKDGLYKIEEFCSQLGEKLNRKNSLLLEIGQGQAEDVKLILHKYFIKGVINFYKDLHGIERVVYFRLT